jgi:hypothetical protein
MKKTLPIIWLFSMLAFITACETLVGEVSPDKLPKLEEKLVINSFISPQDTLVRVFVTTSSPIFTPAKSTGFAVFGGDTLFFGKDAFVNNAKVSMSDGVNEVNLLYNSDKKWYEFRPGSNTMRIEGGQTYFLTVSHENRMAKASCTVPERKESFMQIVSKIENNAFSFGGQADQTNVQITARVTFEINDSGKSFFRMRGDAKADMEVLVIEQDKEPEFVPYVDYRRIRFENQGIINGADLGKGITATISGSAFFSNPISNIEGGAYVSDKIPNITNLYIELMAINEAYYFYYKSILDYSESPFVEPTPIYTNIEGGLGVFAASNRKGQSVFYEDNKPIF